MNQKFRTGIGFDVHAFTESKILPGGTRGLILGGVEIPFEKSLAGHSDADVLLHSISDALLGALSLGDIGQHFPDTDEKYKNADSAVLLKKVYDLVLDQRYGLGNIDAVIAMEKPKLAPYISKIKERISQILNIEINQVSIKATTTEKLGFIGREEGISAFASVLIYKKD